MGNEKFTIATSQDRTETPDYESLRAANPNLKLSNAGRAGVLRSVFCRALLLASGALGASFAGGCSSENPANDGAGISFIASPANTDGLGLDGVADAGSSADAALTADAGGLDGSDSDDSEDGAETKSGEVILPGIDAADSGPDPKDAVAGDTVADINDATVVTPDTKPTLDGGPDPDAGTPDAGTPDAGTPDAGTPDAGTPDAGTPDAGTPDAGTPDAGTPDAGTPDAGTPDAGAPDAGTPDAGTPDAGTPDTGTPDAGAPDAGTPDAGTPDAGTPDAGTPDTGTPDAGTPDAGTQKDIGVPPVLGEDTVDDTKDVPPTPPKEICSDGIDNNANGAVDCYDAECVVDQACVEQGENNCSDGKDNDLDNKVDCADSGCVTAPNCVELGEKNCSDGKDNDLDGSADCNDTGCKNTKWCADLVSAVKCSEAGVFAGDCLPTTAQATFSWQKLAAMTHCLGSGNCYPSGPNKLEVHKAGSPATVVTVGPAEKWAHVWVHGELCFSSPHVVNVLGPLDMSFTYPQWPKDEDFMKGGNVVTAQCLPLSGTWLVWMKVK